MIDHCTSSFACRANITGPSLAEMCGASTFIVFMSLLDELIRSNDKISGLCQRVNPIETPDDQYDFAVIGAGGSGAVIAGRLSENPHWKILLLEAGPDEPPGGQIPSFGEKTVGTIVDWNYTTTNEKNACLAANGACPLSSGKMLGGCTSHNGMIYSRGSPIDYNNWAALGNEGWAWEDVEPFYSKITVDPKVEGVGHSNHSTRAPLPIGRFQYLPPIVDSMIAGIEEAGYKNIADSNGDDMTGYLILRTTSADGVRHSSSRAYLWPARNRKNLHVSINSLASRVIIENHRAVGVEFYKNGELKTVRVTREVIISASAIRSPQILLLSGIGPEEHLKSHDIKMVKNLPGVGENFHNQPGYVLSFTINETDKYDNDYEIAAEYLLNQTGPLSSIGVASLVAVFSSRFTSLNFPDIATSFLGYTTSCAPGQVGALSTTGKRTIDLSLLNLHPTSKGRISLASKDPFEDPVIWANYLGDRNDVTALVDGIKMILPLADTKAFRAHNFTLSHTPIEACSSHVFLSEEYWACAIRYDTLPAHHSAGSCKMGPSSDPLAVVDHQLQVYGIEGLRVADNSIMPQVISGATASSSIMIGERAADFIKKYWDQKPEKRTSSFEQKSD